MSNFSTGGFEISNFLPQKFLFLAKTKSNIFPKTWKNREAKFQILFMQKIQKIQEVKFEIFSHENLAFFWEMSSQKCVEKISTKSLNYQKWIELNLIEFNSIKFN